MDYVGVRRYGPDGKPCGEVRFVGLFTAQAYDEPVRNVPLIRRKIDRVMARAGQAAGGHNDMRLRQHPGDLPARRAVPVPGGRAAGDRAGHPAPVGPAAGEAVRARATRSTASSRCCSTCRASATTPVCARRSGRCWPRPSAATSRPTIPATPTRRWRGCTTSSASRRGEHLDPDLAGAGARHRRCWRAPGATTSRRPCARRGPAGRGRGDPGGLGRRLPAGLPRPLRRRRGAGRPRRDRPARRRTRRSPCAPSATPATRRAASASSSTEPASRSRWPTCCRSSTTWA